MPVVHAEHMDAVSLTDAVRAEHWVQVAATDPESLPAPQSTHTVAPWDEYFPVVHEVHEDAVTLVDAMPAVH